MIQLGSFDDGVPATDRDRYLTRVEEITRVAMRDVAEGSDKLLLSSYTPDSQSPMSIAEIQRALKAAGFFPGGTVDGICGYRTRSAMRLFQEYVRSVWKRSCVPDGRFGALSQQHLRRWIDQLAVIEWAPTIERWRAGTLDRTEDIEWLSLLGAVKDHYASNPGRMLQLVNAFPSPSDTRRVAQWDFGSTDNIHLVGIRRDEKSNKFDDIFVLLIKGLVFKFQGSTEPGASDNPAGVPFLVQGQHDYQFGWHKKQYLALRPLHLDKGVLVVRSKDMRLDEADLNKGLEANASINVHWGGKGMKFDVKNWSEGCQVINGDGVHRPQQRADRLLNLRRHQQWRGAVASNPAKTRGAYNVLVDLVTSLASDLPTNAVRYTLLVERDLDLGPPVKERLADARARAARFLE